MSLRVRGEGREEAGKYGPDGHIKQLGLQAVIVLLKGSAEASHKSAQGLPHLPCPAGGEGHPARKHHGLVELVHGRCPWRASG